MTSEPAAISEPPRITFQLGCSPRITMPSTIVIATLSLSIGATLEASPVCSALK